MCLNFLIRKRRKSKVKAESDRLKMDNKINKNSSGNTKKDRGNANGETPGIKSGNEQGLRLRNAQDEKGDNLEIPELVASKGFQPARGKVEKPDEVGASVNHPSEIPEIDNPFLVDIVIARFLARAEVSSLNKLRKMDIKWNYFGTNIMEMRASKGQLQAVDLSEEYCKDKIDDFFNSTRLNRKLFRSFRLNFEYLKMDCKRISKYSPVFLQLDIKNKPNITGDDKKTLNVFLTSIASEIQDLEIQIHHPLYIYLSLTDQRGPVLPKLTRFAFINKCYQRYDRTAYLRLFAFILAKGGKIDHMPNLTAFEIKMSIFDMDPIFGTDQLTPVGISRWSRLTQLAIHKHIWNDITPINFLHSLGQAGMRLEMLELDLNLTIERPTICHKLSEFFQTQSKSLKILDFKCVCLYPEINSKIRLPIFEVLHTFKLKGNYSYRENGGLNYIDHRMFEMGLFSVHFPKLRQLEIHNQLLTSLFPGGVVVPMQLLEFSILYN